MMTELEIGAMLFLLWNSIRDIRKKEIVPVSILLFVLLRILYFVIHLPEMEGTFICNIADVLVGMIPGILLYGIGKISRGAIGLGDGIAIMVVGLYVGKKITLTMIMWAFFLACFWSILFLGLKKYKSDSRFPFIPFLFLGLVMSLVI